MLSYEMAKKQEQPKSFEAALAELEEILAQIESGEVGLEQSLIRYERGNFLIQHCQNVLNSAEKQIEVLSRDAEGQIKSAPLDEPTDDQ